MKNRFQIILVLPVLMLLMQAVSASDNQRLTTVHHSQVIEKYNAMESDALRISLNDDLTGFVEGKVCDACEVIQVKIIPSTKAFVNDTEVPLKKAKSRIGRYATVFYEIESKNVTEIRW